MRGTQRWLASLTFLLGATFSTLAIAQDTAASAANPPLFHVDLDRCPNNRPGQVAVVVPLGQGFWLPADHNSILRYDASKTNPGDIDGYPIGCRENPIMLPYFWVAEAHAFQIDGQDADNIKIRSGNWKISSKENSFPYFDNIIMRTEQGIQRISQKNTPSNGACSVSQTSTTCISKEDFCFGISNNCPIDDSIGLGNEYIWYYVKSATKIKNDIHLECMYSISDMNCNSALDMGNGLIFSGDIDGDISANFASQYIENAAQYIFSIRDPSLDVRPIPCWRIKTGPTSYENQAYEGCPSGNLFNYQNKENINVK